MSLLYQSVGQRPVSKHTEYSLCKTSLAFVFFIASFGISRKDLCSLDESIALDTSSKVREAFKGSESKGDRAICSLSERLSKIRFFI